MISASMTNLILVVLNFLIMLILLKRFLYTPMLNFLDKRTEKIKNDLDEAERKRKESDKLLEEYKAKLKNAKNEMEEMVKKGVQEGRDKAEEIRKQAQDEAAQIRDDAEKQIEQAFRKAKEELKKDMVDMVILTAEKILSKKIDKETDAELIEKSISEVEKIEKA